MIQRPSPGTRTHIAKGAKLSGRMNGVSDLYLEGEIEGEIDLDSHVAVGVGGLVKGDIKGRSVEVGGRVVGNIRGRERVEILATGRIEGDVSAPKVVLAEGAFLRGKVEMTSGGPDEKGSTERPEPARPAAKVADKEAK